VEEVDHAPVLLVHELFFLVSIQRCSHTHRHRQWRTGKANPIEGSGEPIKIQLKNSAYERKITEGLLHFSCQIHAATEVLLDLGIRVHHMALENMQRNTTRAQLLEMNRSGRFYTPVRPDHWDLPSHTPRETSQAGFVQKFPKRSTRPKLSEINSKANQTWTRDASCWWLIVVSKFVYDLQADKSPVVVKGPFFPRVVNPRYRIRGTNVWCKSWSSKAK
jgi:hypothetical protein